MVLAQVWHEAKSQFPAAVRRVLEQAPEYQSAELVEGIFEKEVDLETPGRNSQTDLLALAGLGQEMGVIAVEGKVDEPFDKLISIWNKTKGTQRQLESLCGRLQLKVQEVGGLRYQLFHRSVAALLEAERFRCTSAMMLVHSFSPTHSHFEDFARFAAQLSIPVAKPNAVSEAKDLGGIRFRLAWVADRKASSVPA